MESRANPLLVGSFVLAAVAAAFFFVLWVSRAEGDHPKEVYDLYLEGSVSGLSVGGDVRYRGIEVGQVVKIAIAPEDPRRVRVTVEIDTATPIRQGDVASLQLQGITGVAYLNVEGAEPGNPLLTAQAGQPHPVIPTRLSSIQQLVQGAPDLFAQGAIAAERAADLLNDENRRQVTEILADVHRLTQALAAQDARLAKTFDALDHAALEVAGAATAVRETAAGLQAVADASSGLIQRADQTLGTELPPILTELEKSAASLRGVADEAQALLAENRAPLRAFSQEGLAELSRFVTEARILVGRLTRLTERIDDEGVRFLLGTQQPEVEPPR